VESIRTLGQFVADEKIIGWLTERIVENHAESTRGASQIAKQRKLPMHCSTCTATKTCCDSYVIVRLYEGLVIAEELVRTGRDTPELRAELAARAELMEATAVSAWGTKCLFLDEGERCTVYAVRPTTCAQLFVYTPPALCNARSSEILSYTPRKEVAAANEVEEQFRERMALRRRVGRRYMGVLPRMVLVSLEAWDRTDFREYLRQQPWLSEEEWAAAVKR